MASKAAISYRDELMDLIEPVAEKIRKGEEVDKTAWPEVAAISQAYQLRISVMVGYTPYYDATQRGRLLYGGPPGLAERISDPNKRKLFETQIGQLSETLVGQLRSIEKEIKRRISAGVAFDAKAIADPEKAIEHFSARVNALRKEYGIAYDREYRPETP